jgi:hypothetical protein
LSGFNVENPVTLTSGRSKPKTERYQEPEFFGAAGSPIMQDSVEYQNEQAVDRNSDGGAGFMMQEAHF